MTATTPFHRIADRSTNPNMHRSTLRPVTTLLAFAALSAALAAQGIPIGFEETFALSPDRSKAVATLIPGTEDYYYYLCRERLGARDFAAVRQVLPTWIERHNRTNRVLEIENRLALLSAGDDPAAAFAFLRERLGVNYGHTPVIPGAKSDLPTRLDAEQLSPARLTAQALAQHPGTVNGFTDAALPGLLASNLDEQQLRSLLQRLDRPDVDNLPALVVRDLARRNSGGFGSLPIHGMLRRAQLDDCLRLQPNLLQDRRFVDVYLQRLLPANDGDWQLDPAARGRHLARLWEFVQRLSPAFNSLKAHVLHHALQHDLTQGAPDRERFLAYLRLPRRHAYPSEQMLRGVRDNSHVVDPNLGPPTLLEPIGQSDDLLRACFEHAFASEDGYESYAEFVDTNWLKRVFAETKLLLGQGDPQRWYALIDSPSLVAELEKRVELRFLPTARTRYAAGDRVELVVETKNVPTLLVKVFAVDAYRYLIDKQKQVDATIELDGIVPNHEQSYRYDDPSMRRVARTFPLPMLDKAGTYVVEFVGNGISSRAVIHKGELRLVETPGSAGHVLRVHDESGAHRTDAVAWFGGREYRADERGEIVLPFSTSPGMKKVVLRAGDHTGLATFQHHAESYQLVASVHTAREALLAGGKARVLVRPQLRLGAQDVPLQLLVDPVLTIVATDHDGIATTQEVRDLNLVDERELVHEIQVPERLASLAVSLRGTVKDLAGKDVPLATPAQSFACNRIDATAETGTALLLPKGDGYVVELRGKNGEPQAGRPCTVQVHLRDYREPATFFLQTNADGRIELGNLPGATAVTVQRPNATGGHYELPSARMRFPAALHGLAGQVLRVPYDGTASAPSRAEFSLLGSEQDEFAHLAIADGFVELRDLAPGEYELRLHRSGARIPVRVIRGAVSGPWLLGGTRQLTVGDATPLQVRASANDAGLEVRVANATAATRVVAIATRQLPTFDPFAQLLGDGGRPPSFVQDDPTLSSYYSGRKLSEEYRYVLERRLQPKFLGNMLARPSLLANPWAIQDSSNAPVGIGGGTGGAYGGRGGRNRAGASARPTGSEGGFAGNPGEFANLDWLPQGAAVLANLVPDADGVVRVPTRELGDGHFVQVVALDRDQAVTTHVVRTEQPLQPRARQLPRSLDPQQHFAEQKRIEFVAAGASTRLEDARQAQVEIHDSLASVFRLFTTLSRDAELAKFGFLMQWPSLDQAQKQKLYDEHACHELHLFLFHKDPQFFAAVVKPLLANKLDKTFIDQWLLGSDLRGYLEPWTFAQLNLVERVLLLKRLGGAEAATIARALQEGLELRPVDRERAGRLLDLALRANELQDASRDGLTAQMKAPAETAPPAPPATVPGAAAAGPGGPPTGGLAAAKPESSVADGKAKEDADKAGVELRERFAEAEKQVPAGHDVFSLGGGGGGETGTIALARRMQAQQLYRAVAATKLLVESNWWHRRLEQTTADVVAPNRFWVDYATAPAGQPFASPHLIEASTSFLEMMAALAVLDLPFAAGKHEVTSDGNARTLKAATPLLLVRKEVQKTEPAADQQPLLLGQNFFRLDDRYRFENGERRDAFVTGEFVVDTAYGCQVVVTNPTSSNRTADVLLQIPAGALPLQKGFWTKGHSVELAPYATATIEYAFYFPAAGDFAHYPAHAAEKGHLAAHAEPRTLHVVTVPTTIDTRSWDHVSQQGSPQDVLAFLDQHNVQRLELARIAWRMKDREFFTMALAKLRARHVYDDTLWSYALLHRDAAACGEYLRHQEQFLGQCGMAIDSPLLRFEPKERRQYQHLELDPLVHPRAHPLGGQRVLGNQDLARQYSQLMTLLGYHDTLSSDDWLVVSYYLLLQDRIEEGLAAFAKVDAAQVAARVQYDYLAAYTCFFTGDTAKAKELATRHKDHPVPHWQQRFQAVLAQIDEAAGGASQPTGEPVADAVAKAAALELGVSGRTLTIAHKNVAQCEVRYYELDVEFAFSAMPFQNQGGTSAAYVQPIFAETKDLPKDQAQLAFELPQRFHQKNVLVEVRAQGLVRSVQYFANDLAVRFLENFGQVVVTTADGKTPLPKAYVKVFARLPGGTVRFHKDGYTDLRGRFDYASLSDDPNLQAERYAVLVLDERRGAVIREIAPPAR